MAQRQYTLADLPLAFMQACCDRSQQRRSKLLSDYVSRRTWARITLTAEQHHALCGLWEQTQDAEAVVVTINLMVG